jgi:hypothetical protein
MRHKSLRGSDNAIQRTTPEYLDAVWRAVTDDNPSAKLPPNIGIEAVRIALGALTPKMRQIIEMRFRRGMTLKSVGVKFNVSREAVRVTQNSALRVIETQVRLLVLESRRLLENRDYWKSRCGEFERYINERAEAELEAESNRVVVTPRSDGIEILHLSTRPYNGLFMSGIRSIGDVLDLDVYALRSIARIGKKSRNEIIEQMRKAGFCAWADRQTSG